MNNDKGLLLVVSGPSGAGKGTICKSLTDRDKTVRVSVSATTRSPREGELHGVNYYFFSREEFQSLIDEGGFIEWAEFCGNRYGTPRKQVERLLESGRDVILEIEVQGAMQVKEQYPDAVFVFVLPPSMSELRSRIEGRGTETEDVIEQRLKTAAWEFSHIMKYDYILLNDDLEKAVARFRQIIAAEKCKTARNTAFIEQVTKS